MAQDLKITCDACGADLTYTGNSVDYRLVLASQGLGTDPSRGQVVAVTDMYIPDPLFEGNKHFCGFECLKAWAARIGVRGGSAHPSAQKDQNAQ